MEIDDSARRHGVPDEDMLHAARFAFRELPGNQTDRVFVVGPAGNGDPSKSSFSTRKTTP